MTEPQCCTPSAPSPGGWGRAAGGAPDLPHAVRSTPNRCPELATDCSTQNCSQLQVLTDTALFRDLPAAAGFEVQRAAGMKVARQRTLRAELCIMALRPVPVSIQQGLVAPSVPYHPLCTCSGLWRGALTLTASDSRCLPHMRLSTPTWPSASAAQCRPSLCWDHACLTLPMPLLVLTSSPRAVTSGLMRASRCGLRAARTPCCAPAAQALTHMRCAVREPRGSAP